MQQSIYLCVLSHQVLQNVLPLTKIEPSIICLAASEQMFEENRVDAFQRWVVDLGYAKSVNDILVLPIIPSSNYQSIREWADEQIQLIHTNAPEAKIILNATGGTKLMSFALLEAVQKAELGGKVEVIYCDTLNEQIETIYPVPYMSPLPNNALNTDSILKAHNIQIAGAESDGPEWKKKVKEREALTLHLGQNMGQSLGAFIGTLNRELSHNLKENIEETRFPVKIALGSRLSPDWLKVLQMMVDLELIRLAEPLQASRPAHFYIDSLAAARYLHGIWLEEYLWLCFLEAGIDDLYSGLKINSLHAGESIKDNELDLVAAHKNNLVIVECKTANISRQQVLNQALDKLSDLGRRSGGTLAQRWFTMARWPLESNSLEDKELAEKFRLQAKTRDVVLIEPRHLVDLTRRLKEWKKTARFPLN